VVIHVNGGRGAITGPRRARRVSQRSRPGLRARWLAVPSANARRGDPAVKPILLRAQMQTRLAGLLCEHAKAEPRPIAASESVAADEEPAVLRPRPPGARAEGCGSPHRHDRDSPVGANPRVWRHGAATMTTRSLIVRFERLVEAQAGCCIPGEGAASAAAAPRALLVLSNDTLVGGRAAFRFRGSGSFARAVARSGGPGAGSRSLTSMSAFMATNMFIDAGMHPLAAHAQLSSNGGWRPDSPAFWERGARTQGRRDRWRASVGGCGIAGRDGGS
jgi:hypothetical protein